jgi:hypothetical protein
MAPVGKEEVKLRKLFAGMDAADDAGAVAAMKEAAVLLRKHDLSFRHIVRQIEIRGLLLPSKVGAAIQLMDSTTLAEAESALAGARRLMRTCGLTFARVIGALDQEPAKAEEIEQLKFAYRIEVERAREMEAELQALRSTAVGMNVEPAGTPFKNLVVVGTLVFGAFLVSSIWSTIADLFRPANATATPPSAPAVLRGNPPPVQRGNPPPVQQENPSRVTSTRPNPICWRFRGTNGPCF